jgi:hypothetical protein
MLVESNGMEGDIAFSEQLQVELDIFIKVKEEMSELQNTEVYPTLILTAIKEHVPSLNIELFEYWLDNIIANDNRELVALTTKIALNKQIQNIAKGSSF